MWAKPDDVRSRWLTGSLGVDDEQLETLIGDVEDKILAEFPGLPDLVATEALPGSRVRRVVVRVALRVLRNPNGYRQVTEGTGPFTGSTTYAGDAPGEITLTAEDRKDLGGGVVNTKHRRAFTIFPGGHR